MIHPQISIVGAGPGDPDLITVKGMKAISSADVILYDALANKELLRSARGRTRKIFVGKRLGMKRYTQDEINEMLVFYARKYGHVVRLKGGDPFVFGRGHEEVSYARSHLIDVDIVPGISSSISLPALQGVPVTRRDISQSFWVLTGTTKKGELNRDILLASQSSATVIILMGLKKIAQISQIYKGLNKGSLPIMVIENGSTKAERVVISTIDRICHDLEREKISTPAVIVIGAVVGLHSSHSRKELLREIQQKTESYVAA